MKKNLTAFVLLFAPAFFASCTVGGNPTSTRYTLTPLSETTMIAVPAIPFGRISVPAYIDTPQIVTRKSENIVVLNETHIWAEPLARSIQRLIPILVSQKLQKKKLKNFEKVSVFIDRLDGSPVEGVSTSAQIVISRLTDTEIQSESFLFSETIPVAQDKEPYVAYVQAISVAVGKIADAVAENISE